MASGTRLTRCAVNGESIVLGNGAAVRVEPFGVACKHSASLPAARLQYGSAFDGGRD